MAGIWEQHHEWMLKEWKMENIYSSALQVCILMPWKYQEIIERYS